MSFSIFPTMGTASKVTDPLKDLQLLIRSRYGLIQLDTAEEDRAGALLKHLADSMGLPYFVWSRTKGLRREDARAEAADARDVAAVFKVYGSASPVVALDHVETARFPAIYNFQGLGDYLDDKVTAGKLADAAAQYTGGSGAIVLTGAAASLPESLKTQSALIQLPPPDIEEYRCLLSAIYNELQVKTPIRVELSDSELDQLLNNLKGLTLMEAQKVLTKVMVEDGRLSVDGFKAVLEAKKTIVEREGLLEYTPTEDHLSEIADLAGLKSWLAKRRELIADPKKAAQFGLTFPRGILLLGVQGCGKSLCAKAVATEWQLPLLKLDPSNLYNKYVGESEKNFQRAMRTAERLAPVVLWIDEIEKAFSQGGSDEDGGVSQRILGTFLGWLQDRKGDVFVVATANDISRLPPEFIRKGRFDEIFFVDLPSPAARLAIFQIHLLRRGQAPESFDLQALVVATEGFSGAEIEQVVVSALYTAFAAKTGLATAHLLHEATLTRPLSRTMKEKVDALREWASTRTVSACVE